jgi:spore coat protein U-like protein
VKQAGSAAFAALALVCADAYADTGVNDQTLSQSFQLRAVVSEGCILGSGTADTASFGTISFGQFGRLPTNVDRASNSEFGSIVIQCTPGIGLRIAIGPGVGTTTIAGGRYLTKGAERLRYQLYQDAGYQNVWGDGSNGGTAMSLVSPPGGLATVPVYARLFSTATMPSAGIYRDTVLVTVTY